MYRNETGVGEAIRSSGIPRGALHLVNQIEVHPYFANEDARAASHRHEIADAHGKTPAQVTLRWHIERGDIVFPKSMREERMRENFEIFDFSLTPDQVAAISGLDQGEEGRTGPNPDTFDWIPD